MSNSGAPRGGSSPLLPTSAFSLALLGVMAIFNVALLRFIELNCYFFGDDYSAFWVATRHPFWRAVWMPVGAQVAPLARTLNEIFFALFRVDYEVALAISVAFYALSAVLLARVSRLLGFGRHGLVVVALFATYTHVWIHLAWWSSAIHRMPFVVLSLLAIEAYLRYRGSGSRRALLLVCVCNVLALGFHVKAVLLPLVLVGVDLCRQPIGLRQLRTDSGLRRGVALCAALLAFNAIWAVAVNWLFGRAKLAPVGLLSQLEFVAGHLAVFAHSMVGVNLFPGDAMWLGVFGLWGGLFVATVALAPRTLLLWAVLLALLVANTLLVSLSSHLGWGGGLMVYVKRYFYEIHFLTLLFLAAIVRHLPWNGPRLRWLTSPPGAHVAAAVLVVIVAAQAAAAYRAIATTVLTPGRAFTKNRTYVANLRGDAERLRAAGEQLVLADGQLPRFVHGLDIEFVRHSQLVAVLGIPAEFRPKSRARYRIDAEGHIVAIR